MSWIYIVGVIVFAILSNVKKAQKGNGQQKTSPRGGMPTFGGAGKDVFSKMRGYLQPDEESNSKTQRSGFPAPGSLYQGTSQQSLSTLDDTEYYSSSAFPESALFPSPDYETGEGVSLEQTENESLESRINGMHKELDQISSTFNQIGATEGSKRGSTSSSKKAPNVMNTTGNTNKVNANQLQNGLIWAEILGPPRSKRPYPTRRQG